MYSLLALCYATGLMLYFEGRPNNIIFAALRDDADDSDHGDILGYIDWITITVKRPNVYQLL